MQLLICLALRKIWSIFQTSNYNSFQQLRCCEVNDTHTFFMKHITCKTPLQTFFSNGFIKLVQKTDRTHSKCHLFLCGGLPHKTHTLPFFWWAREEERKKQNYPSKPLLTHLLVTNRWREKRMEQNWQETKRNLDAVIDRRLLIQNLIRDFKVKNKIIIANKRDVTIR